MQPQLVYSILAALSFTVFTHATPTSLQSQDNTNALQARGTPCSPEVLALASGISANIADQDNELTTANSLSAILSLNPVNETFFDVGQATLLNYVQQGIAIRQNNQAIAPAENAAIPGLAKVAAAQTEELRLTNTLGVGGVDVKRDNATVEKLKSDFANGIVQNMKNLQAATAGCDV